MGPKISLRTADAYTVAAYDIIIGARQKMNVLAGPRQASPIKAPHRAATDNGDFHSEP